MDLMNDGVSTGQYYFELLLFALLALAGGVATYTGEPVGYLLLAVSAVFFFGSIFDQHEGVR